MAGTVVLTKGNTDPGHQRPLRSLVLTWTSDAAGAVNGTVFPTGGLAGYNGVLREAVSIPNGGGTAPTALYDIVLIDNNGRDVLKALGADRSATAIESIFPGCCLDGNTLELRITNAGNAKGGKLILYLE